MNTRFSNPKSKSLFPFHSQSRRWLSLSQRQLPSPFHSADQRPKRPHGGVQTTGATQSLDSSKGAHGIRTWLLSWCGRGPGLVETIETWMAKFRRSASGRAVLQGSALGILVR